MKALSKYNNKFHIGGGDERSLIINQDGSSFYDELTRPVHSGDGYAPSIKSITIDDTRFMTFSANTLTEHTISDAAITTTTISIANLVTILDIIYELNIVYMVTSSPGDPRKLHKLDYTPGELEEELSYNATFLENIDGSIDVLAKAGNTIYMQREGQSISKIYTYDILTGDSDSFYPLKVSEPEYNSSYPFSLEDPGVREHSMIDGRGYGDNNCGAEGAACPNKILSPINNGGFFDYINTTSAKATLVRYHNTYTEETGAVNAAINDFTHLLQDSAPTIAIQGIKLTTSTDGRDDVQINIQPHRFWSTEGLDELTFTGDMLNTYIESQERFVIFDSAEDVSFNVTPNDFAINGATSDSQINAGWQGPDEGNAYDTEDEIRTVSPIQSFFTYGSQISAGGALFTTDEGVQLLTAPVGWLEYLRLEHLSVIFTDAGDGETNLYFSLLFTRIGPSDGVLHPNYENPGEAKFFRMPDSISGLSGKGMLEATSARKIINNCFPIQYSGSATYLHTRRFKPFGEISIGDWGEFQNLTTGVNEIPGAGPPVWKLDIRDSEYIENEEEIIELGGTNSSQIDFTGVSVTSNDNVITDMTFNHFLANNAEITSLVCKGTGVVDEAVVGITYSLDSLNTNNDNIITTSLIANEFTIGDSASDFNAVYINSHTVDDTEPHTFMFQDDDSLQYKLSYLYDGHQESPLSAVPYVIDEDDNASEVNLTLFINLNFLEDSRITHVNIYRQYISSISGALDYRFVESVKLVPEHLAIEDDGNYSYIVKDRNSEVPSYESITGISEIILNSSLNYGLASQLDSYLFVSRANIVALSDDVSRYIFRSMPGKFSQFNWATDYQILPEQLIALQAFNGKLYAFTEHSFFRINPATLEVEDEFEGIGCINNKAVFVSEYGMVFADRNNIYFHNGQQILTISDSISTSSNDDNPGWKDIEKSNIVCSFDNKRQSFLIFFSTIGSNFCWAYNLAKKRWDLWGSSGAVHTAILNRIGNTIYSTDDKIYQHLNGNARQNWFWHSKKLTMGQDTQEKRLKRIRIQSNADISDRTVLVYANGNLDTSYVENTETLTEGTFYEQIYEPTANKKFKTLELQLRDIPGNTEVDAIGAIFKRKSVK